MRGQMLQLIDLDKDVCGIVRRNKFNKYHALTYTPSNNFRYIFVQFVRESRAYEIDIYIHTVSFL